MVARTSLKAAQDDLEARLADFVGPSASAPRPVVWENRWGHLEAIVTCAGFKGVSIVDRQDRVWDFLRKHSDPETLIFLSRVHTLDLDEFDDRYSKNDFAGGSTEIVRLD